MTVRLLERGKTLGRNNDKLDVIQKTFYTFRKESVPVVQSLMQTVGTLKSIHTSSELIQFVSQKLPVETSYALQEYQSVSTSIHKYEFFS